MYPIEIEKKVELLLQEDLRSISQWLDDNHLVINLKKGGKTESMLFGSKPKLAKGNFLDFLMRDTAIVSTKSYKDLRVYLDKKLNMNDDFEKKSQKMQW